MNDILTHFPPAWKPRPKQVEAVLGIQREFDSGKKIVVLEAPTGSGKSFVTHTFARAAREAGERTFMITSQKILQRQYEADFPAPEIELLQGRNAYDCAHPEGKGDTCAYAPCTRDGKAILQECVRSVKHGSSELDGDDLDETGESLLRRVVKLEAAPGDTTCPYWKQLLVASRADVTLFNFSSFLFQQRLKRFPERDLLVIDEVHGVEGQLLNFVEFSLWERDLGVLMLTFDRKLSSMSQVVAWLKENDLYTRIKKRLEVLGFGQEVSDLEYSIGEGVAKKVEEKEMLESLSFKLDLLFQLQDKTEWVVELEPRKRKGGEIERVLVCRPVYARDFARDLLFSKAKRTLCASATILAPDVWARNLGLKPEEVGFVRIGSDFPKENRPIKLEYAGPMTWKEKDASTPKLIAWLKNVCLPRHKGERGIIHAHSFALARAIVDGVGSPRLLLHESGMDKRKILERHAARTDSVIVAPAMHEGIDLKDDLARFAVIAKVPYPSTQDRVVSVRMKQDQDWYNLQVALKIVQSYGRTVRHSEDFSTTYITDSSFDGFYRRCSKYLPDWFVEALDR